MNMFFINIQKHLQFPSSYNKSQIYECKIADVRVSQSLIIPIVSAQIRTYTLIVIQYIKIQNVLIAILL